MSNHETYTKKLLKNHKITYGLTSWDLIISQHKATHTLSSHLQLYQLPYENPHTWQKDINSSLYLFSEIPLKFSFLRILHSDNGTEIKSKLIEHLAQQLGIKKTYISPCHPQSNGKLELSHRFLKDWIWKFSIDVILEWDQLLSYATAEFNWFPNEHSQESPHFLYFGCDPYLPHLAKFFQPKLRYLGSDEGITHIDKLRDIHAHST